MKKALSILIVVTMAFLASAPAVFAKPYEGYPWLYEDFETDEPIDAAASNASISRVNSGVAGTDGAARITVTRDYGTAKFPLRLKKGTTYNVSVWVKVIGTLPANNLHFIFYMHQKMTDGSPAENASCFRDINVGNVTYSTEEFVRVSTTFTYEGFGRLNGVDVETCDGDATVELRLGNGQVGSGTIDYIIDDFIVEPVMEESEAPQEDTSIGFKNGNFETGFDSSAWNASNCTVSVIDGANGTNKGVMITSTGNYGAIQQRVPVEYNKAYRISLYAKAGDDATVGKNLVLYIDRSGTSDKKDSAITTNYPSLPANALKSTPSSLPLTDEWQKIEFIYKNSIATFETYVPNLYTRAGNGQGMEVYCLDELEIEELPDIVYNGDFSEGTLAWTSDKVRAHASDEMPDSGAEQSMMISETSNYAAFSQGINVQPGHSYKISFSAKGESWNSEDEEVDIIPVLDRYASNSTDPEPYEYLTPDSGENAKLTKEWQDYEFEYNCEYSGDEYRVPLFYLQIGDGKQKASYYLNNVKIEDLIEENLPGDEDAPEPEGAITDMSVDGRTIENQQLTLTYDVTGADSSDGVVKIMKSFGNDYVSVGSARLDGSPVTYTLKNSDVGSNLKFTAVLINNESPVSVQSITTDEITYSLNIKPQFTSSITDSEIAASVEVRNNDADVDMVAVLALFDENNAMTAMTESPLHSVVGSTDIIRLRIPNGAGVKKARLYVWEGTSAVSTTMNSLIENISIE